MKKALLATVLALSLVLGLVSCGECTHEQHASAYNASTHYEVCTRCGEKDEATVEAHTPDLSGSCSCGCTFEVISYLDEGFRVYKIYQGNLLVKDGYLLLDGRGAYTLITYNDNGSILKQESFDEDGVMYWSSLYEYNAAGLLTKKSDYYDAEADGYSLYEYDAKGRVIKELDYEADGTLDDYDVFTYDENSRLIREEDYDEDGTLSSYSLYEYDANGKKIKQSRYDEDDVLHLVKEYGEGERLLRQVETQENYEQILEYNALGGLIKSFYEEAAGYREERTLTRDESGNLLKTTEKVYYDGALDYTMENSYNDKGLLSRHDVLYDTSPENNSYTVYTYNETGIRIEQSTYRNGSLHERVRFEYDERWNETGQIFLDEDGNVLCAYVYEYPDESTMQLTVYYSDMVTVQEIVIWSLETGILLLEKEFDKNGDVTFFYECLENGEGFIHQSEGDDFDCTTARCCTDCDFVFAPARAHSFVDGYCQSCGTAEE